MLLYEIVNTVENHRLSVPLLFTAVYDSIRNLTKAETLPQTKTKFGRATQNLQ